MLEEYTVKYVSSDRLGTTGLQNEKRCFEKSRHRHFEAAISCSPLPKVMGSFPELVNTLQGV